MTKEEHNKILNDIKACTDDADRMALIVKLEQDYTGVLAERDTALTNAKQAEETATKYAKLNNDLWLQNSSQEQAGKISNIDTDDSNIQEPPAKRTYEDLESKF